MKRVVVRFVMLAAGIVIFANTAAACTYACQFVSPNCRRCIDTGTFTGQTCQNTGSCGCFYTNYCDAATFAQSIGVTPAAEAATCSTLPADVAAFAELVTAE